MTAAVLDRPGSAFEEVEAVVGGRRLTLEERLSESLLAALVNEGPGCPVCDAQMTAAHGRAAVCDSCGTRVT